MKRRTVLAGGAVAALSACAFNQRTWKIRYKLTVSLQSPDRSASSVIETRYRGPVPGFMGTPYWTFSTQTWGDAPSFETDGGGRLLAMFTGGGEPGSGEHRFAPTHERTLCSLLPNADDFEAFHSGQQFDELSSLVGPHELAAHHFPRFTWFADASDLSTAHFVSLPGYEYPPLSDAPSRALADILGSGANVQSLTIERTDAPITQALDQQLPWLDGMNGDDGRYLWDAHNPYWANLRRQYFALRGEGNNM